METTDHEAIARLASDLHWQIDQLLNRDIKSNTGGPYFPAHYKRGLDRATAAGGSAVVEFVRSYLKKPPSDGFQRLARADSLELTCEWLIADDDRPHAALFNDDDRAAARTRLAPHIASIRDRQSKAETAATAFRSSLPDDLSMLREMALQESTPAEMLAVNEAIHRQAPDDTAALNRIGRAHESLGKFEDAELTFRQVLEIDPDNAVAVRRLKGLASRGRDRSAPSARLAGAAAKPAPRKRSR